MDRGVQISVVSPVYKAELIVDELVSRLKTSLAELTEDYEIILVEDGSPDRSWEAIEEICTADRKVKGIKLSRNFGQHYAITAGLNASKGEWVVVMDCDLQDRPEEIPKLYNKAQEGFEIVLAQRLYRTDSFLKRSSSKLFYKVFGYFTDTKPDKSVANFGIYSTNVIKAVLAMGDHIKFFPLMVQWVGFPQTKVVIQHNQRAEGETSYTWKRLINLALDNILAFSNKPLRITINLGLLISCFSVCLAIYYVLKHFQGDIIVIGYASLIVSIWFLSGLIIFTLGIIGVYLGKVFENVKSRPVYIVEKKNNFPPL